MNQIITYITLPLFSLLIKLSSERTKIMMDGQAWCNWKKLPFNVTNMCRLFIDYREFRTLFYYRIGSMHHCLSLLYHKLDSLYITTPRSNVGGGLIIQHGFATIISAKHIGENCKIYQQVTIGYNHALEAPIIGDNVEICCGAKIIGGINIGNYSLIGANAVVIRNVPAHTIVGGIPAKIIRKK